MLKKIEKLLLDYEGEIVVPGEGMLDFVNLCKKIEIGLLGFDGIRLRGDDHDFLEDWIVDLSDLINDSKDWDSFLDNSIKSSKKIIYQQDLKGLSFVPTLINKETWKSMKSTSS